MYDNLTNKSLYKSIWTLHISRHIQALQSSITRLGIAPMATAMTCLVIGIALALPMGLYVLLTNIHDAIGKTHDDTTKVSIYLNKNISPLQTKYLIDFLKRDQDIAEVTYVSADEGLRDFQNYFGTDNVLAGMELQPFSSGNRCAAE